MEWDCESQSYVYNGVINTCKRKEAKMLYEENVTQAIAMLKTIKSRLNRVYKHHKLDLDETVREISVVQNVLKSVLDTGLPAAQIRLFDEEEIG